MKIIKSLTITFILLVCFSSISGKLHTNENADGSEPPFFRVKGQWSDSVFNSMTPEERIAQLFMVAAYSNKGADHIKEIEMLVEQYKIGGLIFFQGGPVRQAKLTNQYQAKAKVPLLISIDGEWGLAMRLDSTIKYPRQMMLGAIENNNLIYQMGADIAAQCKRLGIHVNLAPVVDVNNNPANPVINSRSFGEDKYNVSKKSIAYMKGMQDNNILACAKHFPGHGDTDKDSHKTLPIIKHDKKRLHELELYPFKEMIKQGLGSMMIAHLYIPSLDSTPNLASTLSKPIVTGLLRKEMAFEGLTFTDALNMKGVSKYFEPGEADLRALLAGNDVLLFPKNVPVAIDMVKQAIAMGKISQEEIDTHVRKILMTKEWVGLNKFKPIETKNLIADLNQPKYEVTKRKLIENAITVLRNENNLLPIKRLDTLKIASITIGREEQTKFQEKLEQYAPVANFSISKTPSIDEQNKLLQKLDDYNLVIIGINNNSERPSRKFGITTQTVDLVDKIQQKKKVILDVFANAYSLAHFPGAENVDALIVSYWDEPFTHDYSAQLIFGGIGASGKLPVTASPLFKKGDGIKIENSIRFKYTIPEELGISSSDLMIIDSIALNGIKEQAYPGCQIFVAKHGKVIYNKSFGYHTYKNKNSVKNDDLYDVASITKIAATLPSLMKLSDEGKISADSSLHHYMPELVDSTPYRNMVIREMLAHQAGLVSWIPFYIKTLVGGQPSTAIYHPQQSEEFPYRVAEDLYINKTYPSTVMSRILGTKVNPPGEYKYSDLGYYLLKYIIEKQSNVPLDEYATTNFYLPLGMATSRFKPREQFSLKRIPPTENDLTFRKQIVQGDVHDPGAAMLGGVGGHAGLFSSANDLAKLMQMYMQYGEYGGARYLKEGTVKDFTRCQYCDLSDNRRGAGFDKPVREGPGGPTFEGISLESFGHSGFTGTLAWADPEEELVYIFLSNRVYPDANNTKLIKMGVRTQIMKGIYKAVAKSKGIDLN